MNTLQALPQGANSTSLPQGANCTSLPQGVNCTSLPQGANCASLPQGATCTSLPQGANCTSLPQHANFRGGSRLHCKGKWVVKLGGGELKMSENESNIFYFLFLTIKISNNKMHINFIFITLKNC